MTAVSGAMHEKDHLVLVGIDAHEHSPLISAIPVPVCGTRIILFRKPANRRRSESVARTTRHEDTCRDIRHELAERSERSSRGSLAASDGGDDRDGDVVAHDGGETVQVTNVIVVDKDVHELTQSTIFVKEPFAHSGVR
jgi:hypothetical protein